MNETSNIPIQDAVHPGETCPTCSRRVPHPRQASSPESKVLAYRIPFGEVEAHLDVLDAVAELLGVKQEKFHRYKAISYAAAAVLQHGLRIEQTATWSDGENDDWCVRCGTEASHTHHRKLRSQGGDDSPANLIRLCVDCHGWVHAQPNLAYATGYLVKSWQDPAEVPVGGEG